MRLLYILTSLGIGGAEKQVISLAERLSANGHTVAFLVLKHSAEEWPVQQPVLRLNLAKTPLAILRGLRFARNFITLFRPQILHSHTYPANIFARLLHVGLRVDGVRPVLINTIHNVHEGGLHRMLLYSLTSPLVDQVTAVSDAAAERFVRLHAVPSNKISVITNAIESDVFCPDARRRTQTRDRMHAGSTFTWLAVGRLSPAKDYPNLLRAFSLLQQRTAANTALWIAGEGDPLALSVDAPELLGTSKDVRWLGLRRDVVELLDAADAFVLSSAWEGMPLVLGEAMSMGKPVVATQVGGVAELLGSFGTLVPPADSEALAAAMIALMSSNELERKRSALAVRERIVQHFSMAARAEQWQQYYKACIARRSHA